MLSFRTLFILLFCLMPMTFAESFLDRFETSDGTQLNYVLLVPDTFDPEQTYPTLLALPPGDQSLAMVEAGFGYWATGEQRGWVIISPVAPQGQVFFQGAERYLIELLDELALSIKFEHNKLHLAGISNGGRSAFRLALDQPQRFHSLLAVPGFPEENDFKKLERLRGLDINMYAGEFDDLWVTKMLQTEQALKELNIPVNSTVVTNEGHVIQSLNPDLIFDLLDTLR